MIKGLLEVMKSLAGPKKIFALQLLTIPNAVLTG
jgi:hypothetical protein